MTPTSHRQRVVLSISAHDARRDVHGSKIILALVLVSIINISLIKTEQCGPDCDTAIVDRCVAFQVKKRGKTNTAALENCMQQMERYTNPTITKNCAKGCQLSELTKDRVKYTNQVFVDAKNGSDKNDGLTQDTAFASINQAFKDALDSTVVYVAEGTYYNKNWGKGRLSNGVVVKINNLNNIKLTNLPGHSPKIVFDGSGGISSSGCTYLEISGLEIEGPNQKITYEEAIEDRLLHSNRFSGRGICIWSGNNIHIHDMKVHDTPNSAIRVNKGDYVTIENNEVYNSTWWSSNAESAIVLAESKNIDDLDIIKMIIRGNTVYKNMNKIPYYNANYDKGEEYLNKMQMHVARKNYGSKLQDFIIDGSGVYITRNSATYLSGWYELSDNVSYENGINGLVVHKTDRAIVKNNILYANGQVSKEAPISRQPYAGLTLTHAEHVIASNNTVTCNDDDFAYQANKSTFDQSDSETNLMNHVCSGKVNSQWDDYVEQGGDKCSACPNNCSGNGYCSTTTGTCFCLSGFAGKSCSQRN